MDVVAFARRVPPALAWRRRRAWEPIGRSGARRAVAGRATWATRRSAGLGTARSPLVLRFANALGTPPPEAQWFAEELAAVTAGSVRVRFVNWWTTTTNTREETETVRGVMRDRADLCWAGTRAFGCLGARALDPLQAPFLLSHYEALAAVCRDDVAPAMLERLGVLGLDGLVVLPGPLRKPFSFARRMVSARDWVGARLRIHESLVAERTYEALGARAVVLSMRQMSAGPAAHVDGLDIQTQALVPWGLRGSITYNIDLWPRTIAIVASQRTRRWLGADERAALHTAAVRTLDRALDHLVDQEERDRRLLPASVTPVLADDDQRRELRERVEPVYAELREHPETGAFLERVETIASGVPAV